MKAIGDCQVLEIVRPVMPKFYSWNGLWMSWDVEYTVHKIWRPEDSKLPGAMVEDGYRLGFFLEWNCPVLERMEARPTLEQLNAVCGKMSSFNRELLQEMFKEAAAQGIKIGSPKVFRTKSKERTYFIDTTRLAKAADLNKQAAACVRIMVNGGKAAEGYTEEELMELLRQHGPMLNTRQDPWRVFVFYKKIFLEMGLLVVEEPEKS